MGQQIVETIDGVFFRIPRHDNLGVFSEFANDLATHAAGIAHILSRDDGDFLMHFAPSLTALKMATRSAQIVGEKAAFSILQPSYISPSSAINAAPTG